MNNITMTSTELLVDGEVVAVIKNFTAFTAIRDALLANLTRVEATYLAVSLVKEARTSQIAEMLDMDKANTSKRLMILQDEGRVEITDEANTRGKQGRPSRVWALTDK
jgi:predicted ArsR family transcriptional regulator